MLPAYPPLRAHRPRIVSFPPAWSLPPRQELRSAQTQESTSLVLGNTRGQAYPFETRRENESRRNPPRTIGTACFLGGVSAHGLDGVGSEEAVAVCRRVPAVAVSEESAKEKVLFCTPGGDTAVYQADRENLTASLAACGNATAAAAALLARRLGLRRVYQHVRLPDGAVEMGAEVRSLAAGSWRVQQWWTGFHFRCLQTKILCRDVIVCTGTFNDYLVLRLDNAEELEKLALSEVLGLWKEGQRFSAFQDPLRSRLVAIAPTAGRPFTRFYTCGRMHPGAPLTGLATLALAASEVSWLGSLLADRQIEHRRGVDGLPVIARTRSGPEARFAAIDVVLHGV